MSLISNECAAWVRAEYRFEISERLKYELFDIGRLLIRNDLKGYRNEAWRKEIAAIFKENEASLDDLEKVEILEALPAQFNFSYLDYQLANLGRGVLDTDQHEVFGRLLNGKMYHAQERLAMRLCLNGRAVGLPEFSWNGECGGRLGYTFDVNYQDQVMYEDGQLVRKVAA